MSENSKPQNSSEEVDLGQLFKLIGDAFNRFFNLIASLFKNLFNLLILLLLFLRKHFWKLVIATFIGGAIGFTIDYLKNTQYSGHLIVEPNFDSTIQLYNNVGYYGALAKDEDSIELAKALGITIGEAASIKAFFIQPVKNEKALRKLYSNFVADLDTASLREISYVDFVKNLSPVDLKTHDIAVVSLDKYIYRKIQPVLVGSILNNPHFKNLQEVHLRNLKMEDSILTNSTIVLDSLRNMYIDVRLREASKTNESAGTTLYMSDAGNGLIVDESQLIEKKNELIELLSEVKTEIQEKKEIINIVSDFPEVGYETKALFESMRVIFALGGFLTVLIIILGGSLNKYLKEKEMSTNN